MSVFAAAAAVFTVVVPAFAAVTEVLTAVAAENTDETAVTNIVAITVKFSLHHSKMSFRARY